MAAFEKMEPVIPIDVLDDLCSRFIINVPEVERNDAVRICFQVELAHWFYIDFYSKQKSSRKLVNFKEFATIVFKHVPFLHPFAEKVDQVIDEWKGYKFCVPTFGAILLSEDLAHVLLVQSFSSKSSWGFPKGKINLSESPWQCAIREVKEETGFDIQDRMDPSDYLEVVINDQTVRLYIIPGISLKQTFTPKTRNEIKSVRWFPLADLPASKKEAVTKLKTSTGTVSLFMVTPFVRKLREWIAETLVKTPKKFRRARNKSCGDIDGLELKDCINSEKKKTKKIPEKVREPVEQHGLLRSASAVSTPQKPAMEFLTPKQASESETKVRRTLEYVMHQNPKIGSPIGQLDEIQNRKTPKKIEILKRSDTVSGQNLLTTLFSNKELATEAKPGKEPLMMPKRVTDVENKPSLEDHTVKESRADSSSKSSLGSIHHDDVLSSFARVLNKSGRNYFLTHSHAVGRSNQDDTSTNPTDDIKALKFVEISFSKNFSKHGAKAWSNFKFDRQAIARRMNG